MHCYHDSLYFIMKYSLNTLMYNYTLVMFIRIRRLKLLLTYVYYMVIRLHEYEYTKHNWYPFAMSYS